MTRASDIFDFLCGIAPLELQMDFDNAGFLLGDRGSRVSKALLALDVTDAVAQEAEAVGAQLIISHHPLIFTPLKALTDKKLIRLAGQNISVICMHTNLDIAKGGVNDVLIALLGANCEGALDSGGCGRVGSLPAPVGLKCFLESVKAALNCAGLRYLDCGKDVHKLAVMGGSGGESIDAACEKGCDTYVTADIKYHQFLRAQELGINLIDADHFCTENPVMLDLQRRLRAAFFDVEFLVSNALKQTAAFC